MAIDIYIHHCKCLLPWFFFMLGLVWCPGQKKRIAHLSFFHECRKRRLKDYQHPHLIDCNQTTMGLPPTISTIFLIAMSFWWNVSEEYLLPLWEPRVSGMNGCHKFISDMTLIIICFIYYLNKLNRKMWYNHKGSNRISEP
jgi:hypothetical protein